MAPDRRLDFDPNDELSQLVRQLLSESLKHWGFDARIVDTADGWSVQAGCAVLRIAPAASDAPFRWTVHDGKRRRTAASVVGLLNLIRGELDAAYEPMHLRVAAGS